jgi:hypothetical protein
MRLLLFLFMLFTFSFCTEKKKQSNCSRFKTGNFSIYLNPEGIRYEIVRTSTTQTEYNTTTDTIVGFNVKWTGPCEYEVQKMYKRKKTVIDSAQGERITEFRNAIPLKVKITASATDYYLFESWKEGNDFVYKDTMWVKR